jgi:hypothetical protein
MFIRTEPIYTDNDPCRVSDIRVQYSDKYTCDGNCQKKAHEDAHAGECPCSVEEPIVRDVFRAKNIYDCIMSNMTFVLYWYIWSKQQPPKCFFTAYWTWFSELNYLTYVFTCLLSKVKNLDEILDEMEVLKMDGKCFLKSSDFRNTDSETKWIEHRYKCLSVVLSVSNQIGLSFQTESFSENTMKAANEILVKYHTNIFRKRFKKFCPSPRTGRVVAAGLTNLFEDVIDDMDILLDEMRNGSCPLCIDNSIFKETGKYILASRESAFQQETNHFVQVYAKTKRVTLNFCADAFRTTEMSSLNYFFCIQTCVPGECQREYFQRIEKYYEEDRTIAEVYFDTLVRVFEYVIGFESPKSLPVKEKRCRLRRKKRVMNVEISSTTCTKSSTPQEGTSSTPIGAVHASGTQRSEYTPCGGTRDSVHDPSGTQRSVYTPCGGTAASAVHPPGGTSDSVHDPSDNANAASSVATPKEKEPRQKRTLVTTCMRKRCTLPEIWEDSKQCTYNVSTCSSGCTLTYHLSCFRQIFNTLNLSKKKITHCPECRSWVLQVDTYRVTNGSEPIRTWKIDRSVLQKMDEVRKKMQSGNSNAKTTLDSKNPRACKNNKNNNSSRPKTEHKFNPTKDLLEEHMPERADPESAIRSALCADPAVRQHASPRDPREAQMPPCKDTKPAEPEHIPTVSSEPKPASSDKSRLSETRGDSPTVSSLPVFRSLAAGISLSALET